MSTMKPFDTGTAVPVVAGIQDCLGYTSKYQVLESVRCNGKDGEQSGPHTQTTASRIAAPRVGW